MRRWSVEEGLAEGAVTSVEQDNAGFLWVTTLHHVMRFDGLRFLSIDEGAPWVESSGILLGTCFDRNGDFIAFGTTGASRFDGKQWQSMPFEDDRHAAVFNVFETKDGALWVVTGVGLARWDGKFLHLTSPPDSAKFPLIQTASFSPDLGCWMTDSMRLLSFNENGYQVVAKPKGVTSSISSLHTGRSGRIFLTAAGRVFHGQPGHWTSTPQMPLEPFGPILETRNGDIWVGSQYGLQRFRRGVWTTLDVRNAAGTGALDVRSIAEGRDGELWAGTSDGLIRLEPLSVRTISSTPGGRDKDLFQAVLPESPRFFWAGVAMEGLLNGDPGNLHPPSENSPAGLTVSALCKARDGSLWIGTQGNYLWWLGDGRTRNLSKSPAGVAARGINAVAEDSTGRIWLGTWEGLMVVDGQQISPMPVVSLNGNSRSPLLDAVHCLLEDRDKALWVGYQTQGLLMRTVDGKQRRFTRADGLPSNSIRALHEDREGVLWIGTPSGLARWAGVSRSVLTAAHGLLEDEDIRQILDDNLGNLWLGTRTGIYRIAKADAARVTAGKLADVPARRFGAESGMMEEECTAGFGSLCAKTSDGKLWFCTHGGLIAVDPAKLQNEAPKQLNVYLEELRADGQSLWARAVFPPAQERPARSKAGNVKTLAFIVPPGAHDIQFHFSAPSFAAPERVRFRWRLEGSENGWSAPVTARVVTYAALPPGNYRFRAMAVDASGLWAETVPATLEVRPYFWQAWWFRGAMALVLIGFVGLGARLYERRRTRRELERMEREQAVERERMRIARDIHDDLGARLTQIMLLSQPAESVPSDSREAKAAEEIYQTARGLVRDVTEIVWAVNPEHDTLDSLAAYFGEFAQSFLTRAGIRCRLDFPLDLAATPLGSHVRHNLFLAFKETLNNIVKHANASKVEISLVLGPDGFVLSIRDDGCGFDPCTLQKDRVIGGNGLANMRHRLTEIGGRCDIQPAPERGMHVVFTVPLRMGA